MSISVIIPNYNCSGSLKTLIDAALPFATSISGEVIVINDGSTDNSMEVISQYENDLLVVIDCKNNGVSKARNIGIDTAKFETIYFIDADDLINFEIMNENIDDIITNDFCYWPAKKIWAGENHEKIYRVNECVTNLTLISSICNRDFHLFMGGFSIKKAIAKKIYFDSNYAYGEDLKFIIEIIMNSKKIKLLPNLVLNYYQHSSSAMSYFNHNRYDSLAAIKSLKQHNEIPTSDVDCLLKIDSRVILNAFIKSKGLFRSMYGKDAAENYEQVSSYLFGDDNWLLKKITYFTYIIGYFLYNKARS